MTEVVLVAREQRQPHVSVVDEVDERGNLLLPTDGELAEGDGDLFLRLSLFSLGGGNTLLAEYHHLSVERFGWITSSPSSVRYAVLKLIRMSNMKYTSTHNSIQNHVVFQGTSISKPIRYGTAIAT